MSDEPIPKEVVDEAYRRFPDDKDEEGRIVVDRGLIRYGFMQGWLCRADGQSPPAQS